MAGSMPDYRRRCVLGGQKHPAEYAYGYSDLHGLYIPFNDHVKEAVPKLVDRLRSAAFVLNPEAITRLSS